MRKGWTVTVYSMSEGRKHIDKIECDDRVHVSRVIMGYKPKRGYKIMKFRVEREWWLV